MRRFAPLLLLVPALVLAACGDTDAPTRPAGASAVPAAVPDPGPGGRSNQFFPLAIGNRWTYERVVRAGGPGEIPEEFLSIMEREVLPPVLFQGREYLLIQESIDEDGDVLRNCILTRQDRTGLYEADDVIGDCGFNVSRADLYTHLLETRTMNRDRAAERRLADKLALVDAALGHGIAPSPVPGDAALGAVALEDGEITRLAYPLHPGQAWAIRDEPLFTSEVIGRMRLLTPAGAFSVWVVSVTPPGLEEGDYVHVYYGRDGYLGHELRVTTSNPKEPDDPIFFEETATLTDLDLGGNRARP